MTLLHAFGVAAILLGAAKGHGTYPRAAAMVIDGAVAVVDVSARTIRLLNIGEMTPEDADLSPEGKLLVFSAAQRGGQFRLYFSNLPDGKPQLLETGIPGAHRFPRFADKGRTMYFSASSQDAAGGPENPLRIRRLDLGSRKVTDVPTWPGHCEFAPVGILGGVAHISTSCFISFDLTVTSLGRPPGAVVASVSGPRMEVAAAPGGDKVVHTSAVSLGVAFFAWRPGEKQKPRQIATVSMTDYRLQPRFVSPKDVVFHNAAKIWGLDTDNGAISELMRATTPPRKMSTTQARPRPDGGVDTILEDHHD